MRRCPTSSSRPTSSTSPARGEAYERLKQQVAEALIRAAQRGVRTHLVVDGVGTGPLPKAWQQRMKSAGVQVRVYSPLGPLGLRWFQRRKWLATTHWDSQPA